LQTLTLALTLTPNLTVPSALSLRKHLAFDDVTHAEATPPTSTGKSETKWRYNGQEIHENLVALLGQQLVNCKKLKQQEAELGSTALDAALGKKKKHSPKDKKKDPGMPGVPVVKLAEADGTCSRVSLNTLLLAHALLEKSRLIAILNLSDRLLLRS